jgi:hypothetical protein
VKERERKRERKKKKERNKERERERATENVAFISFFLVAVFSNVTMSKEFDEFLNLLGTKVRLQGFTGYAGGLDTKTDLTGEYSVATKYRGTVVWFFFLEDVFFGSVGGRSSHSSLSFSPGIEVMFHVSTLLPFQERDLQRVERKRHLGNDVVLIIFDEGSIFSVFSFFLSCSHSLFNRRHSIRSFDCYLSIQSHLLCRARRENQRRDILPAGGGQQGRRASVRTLPAYACVVSEE